MSAFNFLNGTEPGAEGVRAIVQRALDLRTGARPQMFPGSRLVGVFLNPSLRTRSSLELACAALGIERVCIAAGRDSWALEFEEGAVMDGDTVEHVSDAVRALSSYADLLAVRSFAKLESATEDQADPVLSAFVRYSRVPVISLESARFHPLQGLADTATWMAHLGKDLTGQPLTLTWAPHPKALPAAVAQQVVLSAALMGMDITVAHPEGFELDPQVAKETEQLASTQGGAFRTTSDQLTAFQGARVVVAKSWGGFSGYEDRAGETKRRAALSDWRVDTAKMAVTDEAGFMHCLPVRRNVVVTDDVIDGPGSWVQEEAELRLYTTIALLEKMMQARARSGSVTWSE